MLFEYQFIATEAALFGKRKKRKENSVDSYVHHFDGHADNGALLLLVIVVILGVLNVNRFRIYARLSVITEWKYDAPDSVNNSGLNYANCELPRFPPFPLTYHPFAFGSLSSLFPPYVCACDARSAPLHSATLSATLRHVTNN